MSLSTVSNGSVINHADLNQLINVLQQPSGGQEKGKYYLQGNVYTSGAYIGEYIYSLSRNATPVSVAIDTADQAKTNLNTPVTANLTPGGFEVQATGTGTVTNAYAGGNFTIQF